MDELNIFAQFRTSLLIRFIFDSNVNGRFAGPYCWEYIYGRFDSRFDSNKNGRFACP